METLLSELLIEIFVFVRTSEQDLLKCYRICKKWNNLLNHNQNDIALWKPLVIDKWKLGDLLLGRSSWKIAWITAKTSFFRCIEKYSLNGEKYVGSSSKLNVIPSSIISHAKTLKQLHLEYCDLSCLPPQLSLLTNLKILGLTHNKLQSLSYHLSTLTTLEILYLDANNLSSLPLEYSSLINLISLHVAFNPLFSVPSPIFAFTKLKFLSLSSTHITLIPRQIFSLTNLTGLYLSINEISSIPPEISCLTKLENMLLQENLLKSLPQEISTLTGLCELIIDLGVSYPQKFLVEYDSFCMLKNTVTLMYRP